MKRHGFLVAFKTRRLRLILGVVCAAASLANAALPVAAAKPASGTGSAEGRWFSSLPSGGCSSQDKPPSYEVGATIGNEFDGLHTAQFTNDWIRYPLAKIGAIYDPVHRIALFHEHGTDLGDYVLMGNAAPPPIHVRERDLSSIAMGGSVHLGDSVDKVRSTFRLPPTFHAPTTGCVGFYGPPHKPKVHSPSQCQFVGPDFAFQQTLGTVVFRRNRVAVLEWDYLACGY